MKALLAIVPMCCLAVGMPLVYRIGYAHGGEDYGAKQFKAGYREGVTDGINSQPNANRVESSNPNPSPRCCCDDCRCDTCKCGMAK